MIRSKYNSWLLNEIIESKDFARCFSKVEEFAINKDREGCFGIFREKGSPNYLFAPKIVFGNEDTTNLLKGVEYSKDSLEKEFKGKSNNLLYSNEDFKKECLEKGFPFEIKIPDIFTGVSWSDYVKKNGKGSLDNFIPFLALHNHLGKIIFPSKQDIKKGFANSEKAPFYEIITIKGKEGVFPFLIMEFKEPIDSKIVDSQHQELVKNMNNWLKYSQLNPNQKLLNVLMGDFKEKKNVIPNFDWGFFRYNLDKNRVIEI